MTGGPDADAFLRWLRDVLGVELDEWQEHILRWSWATLPEEVKGGPAMSHVANDGDQFTPMNTDGQVAGLPHVPHYSGPQVTDQAALVNPSAGTQGAPGYQVGGEGPAAGGSADTRQVFPDTSVGHPH